VPRFPVRSDNPCQSGQTPFEAPVRRTGGRKQMSIATTTGAVAPVAELDAAGISLKEGIRWTRVFSPSEDPFADIEFELRHIKMTGPDGRIVFEQRDVLVPRFWSENATSIFAQHYLKGPMGTPERETSVVQVINRSVDAVRRWAQEGRPEAGLPAVKPLFATDADADAFATDLKRLLVFQMAGFNSPYWYNIGVAGVPQQCSACFILDVQDTMKSILNWYTEEAIIFKGGSGAGVNLSRVRSSREGLSRGGVASGPVSFMRGADASAGTIRSGGRTRRAAKMVILNSDHPDIEEFVWCKAREERKARALAAAGFDIGVDGADRISLQYQNANNSVRVDEEFMQAVLDDDSYHLRSRKTGAIAKTVKARDLFRQIAQAAWECADPGLQAHTTINHWHTTPAAGAIEGSNPCSEYMHINNSPCNLANTNLIKYLDEGGSWLVKEHIAAIELVALAQTVLAQYGDYPTDKIGAVARGFRQIGQGYTSLGATLMMQGLGYDSEAGRAWSAAISSLMEAAITRLSAKVAAVWGAYPGVPDQGLPGFDHLDNRKAHLGVIELRRQYHRAIKLAPNRKGRRLSLKVGDQAHIDVFHLEVVGGGAPVKADPRLKALWEAGETLWDEAWTLGNEFGYANAHMSVLAPMGTNGYIQDNDTTGIEPALGLRVIKKKVGGDTMYLAVQSVRGALRRLGYSEGDIEAIWSYVADHNSVVNAPGLDPKDYHVFDTSFAEPVEGRYLRPHAHLLMMAAAQPFISGAISKTVNMPEHVTVDDVQKVYMDSWRLGLKAVAIYRDNCKSSQPMSTERQAAEAGPPPTVRFKLPRVVQTVRIKLQVQDLELYVHVGLYANGQPGEVFFTGPNEGSTVNGFLDGLAKQLSLSLQHGTPIGDVIKLWRGMSFEPSGMLMPTDSDFPTCSSVLDLLAQELALLFLDSEARITMGIRTRAERKTELNGSGHAVSRSDAALPVTATGDSASVLTMQMPKKACGNCGSLMEPKGSCYTCPGCGQTTGCS
jgi:ribonucleoside-diphosphate reductase alpha chain